MDLEPSFLFQVVDPGLGRLFLEGLGALSGLLFGTGIGPMSANAGSIQAVPPNSSWSSSDWLVVVL